MAIPITGGCPRCKGVMTVSGTLDDEKSCLPCGYADYTNVSSVGAAGQHSTMDFWISNRDFNARTEKRNEMRRRRAERKRAERQNRNDKKAEQEDQPQAAKQSAV